MRQQFQQSLIAGQGGLMGKDITSMSGGAGQVVDGRLPLAGGGKVVGQQLELLRTGIFQSVGDSAVEPLALRAGHLAVDGMAYPVVTETIVGVRLHQEV